MDERAEQALEGGCQTNGVVRVGETVRRPAHARSDDVRRLLEHLTAAGFDGAPRPLGTDEQGRDVLRYAPVRSSRSRRPACRMRD